MFERIAGICMLSLWFTSSLLAQESPPAKDVVSVNVTKDDSFCQGQTTVFLNNNNVHSRVVATVRVEPDKSLPELLFDRFFNQISPLRYPQTYPELLLPGEQKKIGCGNNLLPGGKPQFALLGAYYPVANLDYLEFSSPEDSVVLKLNQSPQAVERCSHSSIKNPAPTGTYDAVNLHRRNRVSFTVTNRAAQSFNGVISIDPGTSMSIACDNEVLLKNVTLTDFSFIRYGFY